MRRKKKKYTVKAKYVYQMGNGYPLTGYFPDGTKKTFPSRAEVHRQLAPEMGYWEVLKLLNMCCNGEIETVFGARWRNEKPELYEEGTEAAEKEKMFVGKRFGSFTVAEKLSCRNSDDEVLYACECDCGSTRVYTESEIASGKILSCGCVDSERVVQDAFEKFREEFDRIKAKIAKVRRNSQFYENLFGAKVK